MSGIFEGLQKVVSAIQSIIDGIQIGVEFLINLVKSIFQLVKLVGTTLTNTMLLTATLPSWLIAIATATIGVAVLYMIVGRESGK